MSFLTSGSSEDTAHTSSAGLGHCDSGLVRNPGPMIQLLDFRKAAACRPRDASSAGLNFELMELHCEILVKSQMVETLDTVCGVGNVFQD